MLLINVEYIVPWTEHVNHEKVLKKSRTIRRRIIREFQEHIVSKKGLGNLIP